MISKLQRSFKLTGKKVIKISLELGGSCLRATSLPLSKIHPTLQCGG